MAIKNTNLSPLLKEGANITLTQSGQVITIAANDTTNAPGGSDTQVQFNDGGNFGGDAGLTYNKTTNVLGLESIDFAQTPTATNAERRILWDNDEGTAVLTLKGGNVTIPIGHEVVTLVYNAEATTLNKGEVVYAFGAQGQRISVKRAVNTGDATSAQTIGVVAESIASGAEGWVMVQGMIRGLDTSAYVQGDALYLGSTAGTFTKTKPYAPNHLVYVGIIVKVNASSGEIFVRCQNGYELDELHNVSAQSPSNNDILAYNTSTNLWEKKQLSAISGVTGTGTQDYVAKFTATGTTIGNSIIRVSGTDATYFSTYKGANSVGANIFIGGGGQSSVGAVGETYKGAYNSALGVSALSNNTTGFYNSAVGVNALVSNTTGYSNSAIGVSALYSNTTGYYNSALGVSALYYNTTGVSNSAVGFEALFNNTTGYLNSALGVYALYSNTTGYQNSALGVSALSNNTTGNNNSAVGVSALYSNTEGNSNTALGFQAGYGTGANANTTGTNNIFIGYQSVGVSATESNRTWIGNSSTVTSWIGGNLLLGSTTTTGERLQVTGNGYFTGDSTLTSVQVNNSSVFGFSVLRLSNTGSSGRNYDVGVGGSSSGQNGLFYIYDNTASATRFSIDPSGYVTINQIPNATTDTDRFLVSDSGVIKYRTGSEILSDIGAQAALTNPVTGTGSSGQVAYFNGTTSITSESNLFWDATNNRLGINNASPSYTLDINGNTRIENGFLVLGSNSSSSPFALGTSTAKFQLMNGGVYGLAGDVLDNGNTYLQSQRTDGNTAAYNLLLQPLGGNVGIGTASTTGVLTVVGSSAQITMGTDATHQLLIGADSSYAEIQAIRQGIAFDKNLILQRQGGNVLINTTTNAGYKLDVNGTGRFQDNLLVSKNDAVNDAVLTIRQLANGTAASLQLNANNDSGASYNFIQSSTVGGTAHWRIGGNGTTSTMHLYTGGTIKATLDSSGNLGLGVTPSAWGGGNVALDMGGDPFSGINAALRLALTTNAYAIGATYYYRQSGLSAQQYRLSVGTGNHEWYNAPSGTAGNAISFTQAMTLDASGRLGIGLTAPTERLVVRSIGNSYANSAALSIENVTGANKTYFTNANGILYITNNTTIDHLALFSNGNLSLSGTSDTGERLQVNGTMRVSGASTLSGAVTMNATVSGNNPILELSNSNALALEFTDLGQAANNRKWQFNTNSGIFYFRALNDARSSFTEIMQFTRTGAATFSSSVTAENNTPIFYLKNPVVADSSQGAANNLSAGVLNFGANGAFPIAGQIQTKYAADASFGRIADMIFSIRNTGGFIEAMRIASSGNVGIGVTPSAWGTSFKAIEIGRVGSSIFASTSVSSIEILTNAYVNSGNNYIYANNGAASDYYQYNGAHYWYNAPSGTAGNAISFTEAMTLASTGNLLIGTTTDNGQKLQVNGDALINGITVGRGAGNISNNVVIGNQALYSNTTGDVTIAIGQYAGFANTTGYGGIYIGYNSSGSSNANFNTSIGYSSLASNVSGTANTVLGSNALYSTTGSNNVAIGADAGQTAYSSGTANTSGSNNIFIGYRSIGVSATESNRTWIGNTATETSWIAGNLLLGSTTTTGERLQVTGTSKFTDQVKIIGGNTDVLNFKFSSSYGNTNIGVLFDSGSDAGNSLSLKVNNASGTATERLVLIGNGQLKLNSYTSTTSFTGTAAGYLAFDSSGNILSAAVPSSGIGGSTGSTDNAILRADGTGGSTLQASSIVLSDTADLTLGTTSLAGTTRTISADSSSANVALNLVSKGTGQVRILPNDGATSDYTSILAGASTTITTFGATVNDFTQATFAKNFIELEKSSSVLSSLVYPIEIYNNVNGTPAIGTGVGIQFTNKVAAGIASTIGYIDFVTTAVGSGTTDSDFVVRALTSASVSEKFRVKSTGQLKASAYTSSSSFSGTAAGYLAFTSSGDIITTTTPTGGGESVGSKLYLFNSY